MTQREYFELVITFFEKVNMYVEDEHPGIDELQKILGNDGFQFFIKESEYPNVVMIETPQALKIAKKIGNTRTKTIAKVIPIDIVTDTHESKIQKAIQECAQKKAKTGDTFKICFDPRGNRYINHQQKLVDRIKKDLQQELALIPHYNNPDWILPIEVVGPETGVGIQEPHHIIEK